jgi:murein DD-endopeptidase MepM/ murein hydrolase activator NlpD
MASRFPPFFCLPPLLLALACAGARPLPLALKGVWHEVAPGETAGDLAARYAADEAEIVELNDLPPDGALTGREQVFVPTRDGRSPGVGAPPPRPLEAPAAARTEAASGTPGGTAAPASASAGGSCGASGRPCFAWPVDGELRSGFGPRGGKHHDGIDIAAPEGTPIRAAADGKAIYSGDAIQGYGNLVILRHDGGIVTIYAHNSKNLVEEGAEVQRGEAIAEVGQTGAATAPHVHFEVRVDERPRDPLLYLPPGD